MTNLAVNLTIYLDGHPSKYWPSSTPFNFCDLMGSGVSDALWTALRIERRREKWFYQIYLCFFTLEHWFIYLLLLLFSQLNRNRANGNFRAWPFLPHCKVARNTWGEGGWRGIHMLICAEKNRNSEWYDIFNSLKRLKFGFAVVFLKWLTGLWH